MSPDERSTPAVATTGAPPTSSQHGPVCQRQESVGRSPVGGAEHSTVKLRGCSGVVVRTRWWRNTRISTSLERSCRGRRTKKSITGPTRRQERDFPVFAGPDRPSRRIQDRRSTHPTSRHPQGHLIPAHGIAIPTLLCYGDLHVAVLLVLVRQSARRARLSSISRRIAVEFFPRRRDCQV
jgi:hypothetical protein